ncbi:uncharacterized protein LOC119656321 isoform X1 [Hermetia illucens]|nr:uncharacterized protein LOC119656321 isoform X1 [Hermetia illucens]
MRKITRSWPSQDLTPKPLPNRRKVLSPTLSSGSSVHQRHNIRKGNVSPTFLEAEFHADFSIISEEHPDYVTNRGYFPFRGTNRWSGKRQLRRENRPSELGKKQITNCETLLISTSHLTIAMSREALFIAGTAGRREKYLLHNTLSAVPLLLINKAVLIDLRNETSVAGRVTDVDAYMNITLNEVVYIDQKGLQYEFENFMIPSRTLRQIHLPESVDIVPELRKFLEAFGAKRTMKQGRTGKVKRAQDRHKHTVEAINKNKSDKDEV